MPQAITHYLIAQEAFSDEAPILWQRYSQYAGFGSFGADLFSLKDSIYSLSGNYDYMAVADLMHWEGSLDFYCAMLDEIKKLQAKGEETERLEKLKAYVFGYFTHIVSDTLFHPYVYRYAEDHWRFPEDKKKVAQHKKIESRIDSILVQEISGQDAFSFDYPEKISCFEDEKETKLDEDIFMLLNKSIKKVYKKLLIKNKIAGTGKTYQYYFGQYPEDENHPIHDAYKKVISMLRLLYGMKLLKYLPIKMLKAVTPLKKIKSKTYKVMNERKKNWYKVEGKSKLKYSVRELFSFSVGLSREGINQSLDFLKSKGKSAKHFFRTNGKHVFLLQENYNLDSGHSAHYNAKKSNSSHKKNKRFGFRLGDLSLRYKQCQKILAKQENDQKPLAQRNKIFTYPRIAVSELNWDIATQGRAQVSA